MMSSVHGRRADDMELRERTAGDAERIEKLIHAESHAKRRHRMRIVLLALRG